MFSDQCLFSVFGLDMLSCWVRFVFSLCETACQSHTIVTVRTETENDILEPFLF